MVDFTYNPSQYYARTPSSNIVGVGLPPIHLGGVSPNAYNNNNIGIASGYNPLTPLPGTVGYSLPAQYYPNYSVNNPAKFGIQTLKTGLVNTAINAAVNVTSDVISNALGLGSSNPSSTRLLNNGLMPGAAPMPYLSGQRYSTSQASFLDNTENRVIIYDQTGRIIQQSDVMTPLAELSGVLFPYTPQISITHKANYDMQHLVHTNYVTPMYQYSSVDSITIQADFSAATYSEAEYMAAMLWFFKSVTKMFYGQDELAGTPPPVLYLDGHGPYVLDHIPVVITEFSYSLPSDVDYISCQIYGYKQRVPTSLTVNITAVPVYSRNRISNEFGAAAFSQGALIVGPGASQSPGGWI